MRLELDDFSTFEEIKKGSESLKATIEAKDQKELERIEQFYQNKIEELEKHYNELINKVSQQSYEQGFNDASQKLQEEMQKRLEEVERKLTEQKREEINQLQQKYQMFEEELEEKYKLFLSRFTDIFLDNVAEILEFLFIDKQNTPTIYDAIKKLLDDFSNYLPLSVVVSPQMYEEMKDLFKKVEVKKSEEFANNEFAIEFSDFKIENRIKQKLDVIKDEIKRETKKLT